MAESIGERIERSLRFSQKTRAYIPKADGRQRPLGIAALEDKVVQQAVVTVLNQIYEEDFVGFSYGFDPGRSQHQALDARFSMRTFVAFSIICRTNGWSSSSSIASPTEGSYA